MGSVINLFVHLFSKTLVPCTITGLLQPVPESWLKAGSGRPQTRDLWAAVFI